MEEEKIKVNQARLVEIVDYMSSGESSLLFIFCNIVANIRYDSLILFDEPETHLHRGNFHATPQSGHTH